MLATSYTCTLHILDECSALWGEPELHHDYMHKVRCIRYAAIPLPTSIGSRWRAICVVQTISIKI